MTPIRTPLPSQRRTMALAAGAVLTLTGFSVFSVAARIPTNLNDNVVTCGSNANCSNKVMFGRNYRVMQTAKFTVMVSISNEGPYTRADVSVTNNGGYSQNISPEDFRVEVVSPKPHVLLYVPPEELQHMPLPKPEVRIVSAPVAPPINKSGVILVQATYVTDGSSANSATTPPAPPTIDELYEAARLEAAMKEAAEREAAEKHLRASAIPANEYVRGRVYFQRDHKAKEVNVVLPVAGQVFEFPYAGKF